MISDRRQFLLFAALLATGTLIVYAPVAGFGFSEFDDTTYVVNCPLVQQGWTWPGVCEAFKTFRAGNWHPLTWLSLMADRQLFGPGPRAFHLTNLALHVASTLLLLAALCDLTGIVWRSALVAALFALHPLHVESVAWVSERKDVLSAFFWMLALWSYSQYARRRSAGWYLAVLGSFSLGLLAKPMVITLPCVLLLLDYWPLGRFLRAAEDSTVGDAAGRGNAAKTGPSRKMKDSTGRFPVHLPANRLLIEKLPLFALVALSSLATLYAQRHTIAPLSGGTLAGRTANAVTAYVAYLCQAFWPVDLACFYPHPRASWVSAGPPLATLLLAAVTVLVIRARRAPWLPVGWLWYLGTLVPVIGLIQVGGQARADRYTYIPLVGIFLMAAWSIPAEWLSQNRGRFAAVAAVVFGGLMLQSWRQVAFWRDDEALFEHALAVTKDNWVAQINLGYVRQKQGRPGEAEKHYREALRIAPASAMAHALLSELALRRGDSAGALRHAQAAVDSNPNIPESQSALGMASAAQGNLDKAIEHFRLAIRLMPDQPQYHHFLGLALSDSGRLDQAAVEFRIAIRLKPNHPHAHNELGTVFVRQGHLALAIAEFQTALRINPGLVTARQNLRKAEAALAGH